MKGVKGEWGVRDRTAGLFGWRVLAVAGLTAVLGQFFVARAGLPGSGAALFALAVPFALGGWAFHAVAAGRSSLRRDLFVGVAAGTLICALIRLVW